MPHGTGNNEGEYHKSKFFKNVSRAVALNTLEIRQRDTKCIFERHNYYPADYFFFEYRGTTYFGRKILSQLYIDGKQSFKKCNQLTAPMILGLVLRTQVMDKGIAIYFKPLFNSEKVHLFDAMKSDKKIDVYFPFPVLGHDRKEAVQSSSDWDAGDELPDTLNVGEEHIRAYTIEYLSQFDMSGKVVYDPACSTGKFIGSVKSAFPNVRAIGQDLNPDMAKYARKYSPIDEVHHGDSLYPCIEKESADFVFLRFLNMAVLTTQQALKYFCKLSQTCKVGGTMIVFGFTPVLLSAEIFDMLGLRVDQTTAYSKENDSVFQYYVLTKTSPTLAMRYEDFSAYHLASKEIQDEQIKLRAKL